MRGLEVAKGALGVDKRRSIPWYEERDLVDRRFGSWRKTIRHSGLRLEVGIMLDGHWDLLPRAFVFVYSDSLGGTGSVQVPRRLVRLETREVVALARKHAGRLSLGPCARCGRKGIRDRPSFSSPAVSLCEPCFRAELRAESRKLAAREQAEAAARAAEKKARGYKYRLDLWIHPKSGTDDYRLERYYKTRPLRADIDALARRFRSAILGDYRLERL